MRGFKKHSEIFLPPPTQGPDLTLNLIQVFINFINQNGPICAGQWHQSISGEILPHFDVNIIFLAQKLTKLSVI